MTKMKIKFFSYNTFLIKQSKTKIAIDPGLNLWIGKLNSLIPKSEWPDITHIVATHGDPDHYWHIDRVAEVSQAPIICGQELVKIQGTDTLMLDPRKRGVQYSTKVDRVHTLDVGKTIEVNEIKFQGLKAVHGPLVVQFLFGLIRLEFTPGPGERVGLGTIGIKITLGDKTLVNLGDSLLQKEWEGLKSDILMIPIGGRVAKNTMDEDEALEAVKLISPKLVIPCHYNEAFFWRRNCNQTNDQYFKKQVEDMDIECKLMGYGDEIVF